MPFYAVNTGDIFLCVEAESPEDAACKAMLQAHRDRGDVLHPGSLIEIHEAGTLDRDKWYIASEGVMAKAGFVYGDPKTNTTCQPPELFPQPQEPK